jgi:hypothetical protein
MVTLGHKRRRTALVHKDSMGHMGQLRRVHKGPRPGRLHNRSKVGRAYMHCTAGPLHTAERIARLLHLSPPTVVVHMRQVTALHK